MLPGRWVQPANSPVGVRSRGWGMGSGGLPPPYSRPAPPTKPSHPGGLLLRRASCLLTHPPLRQGSRLPGRAGRASSHQQVGQPRVGVKGRDGPLHLSSGELLSHGRKFKGLRSSLGGGKHLLQRTDRARLGPGSVPRFPVQASEGARKWGAPPYSCQVKEPDTPSQTCLFCWLHPNPFTPALCRHRLLGAPAPSSPLLSLAPQTPQHPKLGPRPPLRTS